MSRRDLSVIICIQSKTTVSIMFLLNKSLMSQTRANDVNVNGSKK